MTVEELREALRGMPDDAEAMVRIQGLNRPLEGVFTETGRRLVPFRWDEVNELAEVETVVSHRLILSDRKHH